MYWVKAPPSDVGPIKHTNLVILSGNNLVSWNHTKIMFVDKKNMVLSEHLAIYIFYAGQFNETHSNWYFLLRQSNFWIGFGVFHFVTLN